MFERYLFFRRHRVGHRTRCASNVRKHLQEHDLRAADKLLERSKAIEARVAREALRWAAGGPGAMTDAVDSELSRVKGARARHQPARHARQQCALRRPVRHRAAA